MITIREGAAEDLQAAYDLIVELAVFEKEPNAVETTIESMFNDAFGERPVFGFFVAEVDAKIVGLSLYYYRYSTWKGRRLYLEDLIVTEAFRGKGVGKALFERTVEKACEDDCNGMSWQVLDWNEPAIQFYHRYGAQIDKGWLNCSLTTEQITK